MFRLFKSIWRDLKNPPPRSLDVCLGVTGMFWGWWAAHFPDQLAEQPSFGFLDPINPDLLGASVIVINLLQIVGAINSVLWWRGVSSLIGVAFYAFLAIGIHSTHPALGVTTYSGLAFMNAVILVRLYGI